MADKDAMQLFPYVGLGLGQASPQTKIDTPGEEV
jgi:hypothetical protein